MSLFYCQYHIPVPNSLHVVRLQPAHEYDKHYEQLHYISRAGQLNVHCGGHRIPIVKYVVVPIAPHRFIIRPFADQWLREIIIPVIRQFEVASGSCRRAQSREVTEPITDIASVLRYDCSITGKPHVYKELFGNVLAVARWRPRRLPIIPGGADSDCYVARVVESPDQWHCAFTSCRKLLARNP